MKQRALGNLIIVTGPSGVGKGTVVAKLLAKVSNVTKSVSVTTRSMRAGEVDGVDYFFRTEEQFGEMIESGQFLEWAEFAGNFYGTPKGWVREQLDLREFPEAVLIFLSPPSFDELKNRLRGRATESPAKVVLRLAKARQEIREKGVFHYEVVNDNIDEAVTNLSHIVYAERCRIRDRERFRLTDEHHQNS